MQARLAVVEANLKGAREDHDNARHQARTERDNATEEAHPHPNTIATIGFGLVCMDRRRYG